jgi:molybdopterin molybdotransferase
MAQLSDDCFAFGGRLIPLAEAEAMIAAHFQCTLPVQTVALAAALGHVLAAPLVAGVAIPPHDNSAVDGYAVRFADLNPNGPTVLPVSMREAAGHASGVALPPRMAARVFTGALMPPGADTVLMQEDCQVTEAGVVVPPGIHRGDNSRHAGEDIALGEMALPAGRRLTPPDLALLAALGQAEIAVRRPLRAALFSTGDEVVEPGTPLVPGQIFDANRFMLAAMLRRMGAEVTDGGILPDNPAKIRDALTQAAGGHDVVMTSGGVSAGDEDHVRDAICAIGTLRFWRVAIRPGRPITIGETCGTPLIGLPGNPVAALVTFVTLARLVVDRLAGVQTLALPHFPVVSGFAYRKKRGRREYPRVTLQQTEEGLCAQLFPKPGAGIITSLTHADALLDLPEEMSNIAPGDTVWAIPLGLLYG